MMDFLERLDAAARATDRIIKIITTTFPEETDEGFAARLALMATVIDEIAIRAKKDPVEVKKKLAAIGEAIEVLCKQEAEGHDSD